MKKRRRIFAFVFFLLAVAAIVLWWLNHGMRYMTTDITSTNGSHYSVLLPNDMQPADPRLNENASLEYESKPREIYVMVIDESKAKIISFGLDYDLDTYMKIASRTLDSAGMYVNKPMTINGIHGLQAEIHSTYKGKKVVYRLTCLESSNFFYRFLVWTPEMNYESNRNEIDKIINSFKEEK